MKTNFSPAQLTDNRITEADAILQTCVLYGFYTNTCPTYVLTRDENESPRGRIDLIKEMLEDDGPPGPMRAAGKCRRNLSQEAFSLGARRSTTSPSTLTRPQTRSEPHAATSNPCSTRTIFWPPTLRHRGPVTAMAAFRSETVMSEEPGSRRVVTPPTLTAWQNSAFSGACDVDGNSLPYRRHTLVFTFR